MREVSREKLAGSGKCHDICFTPATRLKTSPADVSERMNGYGQQYQPETNKIAGLHSLRQLND